MGAFRWNIFFKEFELQGGGDKVLAYLTLWVQSILMTASQASGLKDGQRQLEAKANAENFSAPGDANFVFAGYAQRGGEAAAKAYFKQLRRETVARMIPRLYPDGNPNKWWFQFSKKKFMNMRID